MNGFVYVWLSDLGYLSLVSSGSVNLDRFLASNNIPMAALTVVEHEMTNGEWAEIRLSGQLYAILVSPGGSGPFASDRKQGVIEQLKSILGETRQIRIAA